MELTPALRARLYITRLHPLWGAQTKRIVLTTYICWQAAVWEAQLPWVQCAEQEQVRCSQGQGGLSQSRCKEFWVRCEGFCWHMRGFRFPGTVAVCKGSSSSRRFYSFLSYLTVTQILSPLILLKIRVHWGFDGAHPDISECQIPACLQHLRSFCIFCYFLSFYWWKSFGRPREMAQRIKILVFPKDLNLVSSTHIMWLTFIYNSSSRGSSALFWPPWTQVHTGSCTFANTPTPTHFIET